MRTIKSWLAVAALLSAPLAVRAQQAGQTTITGRVTGTGSGAPLSDSRVYLVGTSTQTVTNSDGRYTLHGVPNGSVQVRVIRVGYQEQKRAVVTSAGQTVTLDVSLEPAVVRLQDIVTTATGEQRKVELGNSIATLGDISQKVEQAPVTNLTDLMVAKTPGVIVLPGNMTGSAPVVRIRGFNSLSLSNDPIYVIDGIRMNSGTIGGGVGGTNTSYLNALDPNEIEDIEIVKGPSAATLYGTDAANGVVVITTRKGKAGAARWTWYGEAGAVQDRNSYPSTYATFGHDAKGAIKRCQLVTIATGACIADSLTSFNVLGDQGANGVSPIHMGNRGQAGMNLSGGSDAVRYFFSGDLESETGPLQMPNFAQHYFDSLATPVRDEWLHPEMLQRKSFRANINSTVSPKLDVSATAGFSQLDQRLAQVDNNTFSFLYNALNNPGFAPNTAFCTANAARCLGVDGLGSLGEDLNGYGFYSPAQMFQVLTTQGIQRFIGSSTAQWRPMTWMQNEATVGLDLAARDNYFLCRFNECPDAADTRQGTVGDNKTIDRNFSAKINSASSWQPMLSLNLKTTVGADYVNIEQDFAQTTGNHLPPGAQNVGQAAILVANSQLPTATKTLGLYVQEQASLRDRMFITAAVRTDQNSAFGTQFQRVYYPKLSLSWVLSDESFFPKFSFLNQFRLRSAYGASGVQPGAVASLQTFAAATVNVSGIPGAVDGTDTPGLLASAIGNPALKPERSTETEAGFETRLFGRLNLDFTYFNKNTRDALIAQPIPSSTGAAALTVTRNLGSVQNTGVEAAINATIFDRRSFAWDATISASHTTNKIKSLGLNSAGAPNPTIGTGAVRDSLGLPANSFFYRPFHYSDANGDGLIAATEVTVDPGFVYMGYSQPRDVVSIQNGFDFLQRKLHLSALLDYKGGYNLLNQGARFTCQQTNYCAAENDKSTSLFEQARLVAARYASPTTQIGYLENGQFWRLREVSATATLPASVANAIRSRDASVTFSARNLHTWTKYTGVDPEANFASGRTGIADIQTDLLTIAPPSYFIARLNLHY